MGLPRVSLVGSFGAGMLSGTATGGRRSAHGINRAENDAAPPWSGAVRRGGDQVVTGSDNHPRRQPAGFQRRASFAPPECFSVVAAPEEPWWLIAQLK